MEGWKHEGLGWVGQGVEGRLKAGLRGSVTKMS